MAFTRTMFVASLLLVICAEAVQDIPDFLRICHVHQPNYETCVINSIEYLRPYLKTGVPDYNIPALEPLHLKRLMVTPSDNLRLQATKINAHGASNFRVTKLKVDLDKMRIFVDVALPKINIDGEYDISGKLLLFPIHGNGQIQGNFSNCIGACRIQAERYVDKDGVERIRITDFRLKVSVKKGRINLDNLFNGDKMLGAVVNTAINDNFDHFLKELLPLVEKSLSDAFHDITDHIVKQFSYAQLFPGM